ncbi:MAG: helix-turn-helix transcriptional regulator, partial [Planctomycetales bacterium]
PLPPGHAYVCPPSSDWGWRFEASKAGAWDLLFVRLIAGARCPLPKGRREPYVLTHRPYLDLLQCFHQLHRETINAGRSTVVRCLGELIAFYARELVNPDAPTDDLADLWISVATQLAEPWSLKTLASEAGVSQEKLRQLCRNATDRSPMRQVAFLRMRRAAELLKDTELTVEEIASRVGYPNSFNFSTAFRRHCDLPPSEYRRAK